MQVKSNQFATKSSHDPSKDATDFASSDHSHGAANEIEAHEAVELKIAFASAIVGPRNLAIEREEQANGKLGHGAWRIVGDVHDFDAEGLCGSYVDLIETSGTRRNELRTAGAELFEHHTIKEIVYKDADDRKPLRQRCRIGSEERIEKDQLVSVIGVQLGKQRALVAPRTEHCDAHVCSSKANAPRFFGGALM
jgi:hypothetical protein